MNCGQRGQMRRRLACISAGSGWSWTAGLSKHTSRGSARADALNASRMPEGPRQLSGRPLIFSGRNASALRGSCRDFVPDGATDACGRSPWLRRGPQRSVRAIDGVGRPAPCARPPPALGGRGPRAPTPRPGRMALCPPSGVSQDLPRPEADRARRGPPALGWYGQPNPLDRIGGRCPGRPFSSAARSTRSEGCRVAMVNGGV